MSELKMFSSKQNIHDRQLDKFTLLEYLFGLFLGIIILVVFSPIILKDKIKAR